MSFLDLEHRFSWVDLFRFGRCSRIIVVNLRDRHAQLWWEEVFNAECTDLGSDLSGLDSTCTIIFFERRCGDVERLKVMLSQYIEAIQAFVHVRESIGVPRRIYCGLNIRKVGLTRFVGEYSRLLIRSDCERTTREKFSLYTPQAIYWRLVYPFVRTKLGVKLLRLLFAIDIYSRYDTNDSISLAASIYIGRSSQYRKTSVVTSVKEPDTNLVIEKIAKMNLSKVFLRTEFDVLQYLSNYIVRANIPKVHSLREEGIFLTLTQEHYSRSNCLVPLNKVADFLSKLHTINSASMPLSHLINSEGSKSDFKSIARLIRQYIHATGVSESLAIQTSFSHGDFAFWNMFLSGGELLVYDWEFGSRSRVTYGDSFYFSLNYPTRVETLNQLRSRNCWLVGDRIGVSIPTVLKPVYVACWVIQSPHLDHVYRAYAMDVLVQGLR